MTAHTTARRRAEAAATAKAEAGRRRRRRLLAGAALLVAVAVVAAVVIVRATSGPRTIKPGRVQAVDSPTAQLVPQSAAPDGASLVLNPGVSAALTVDDHIDYACPPCRTQAASLGPVLEDLAARGEIVLRYHVRSYLDTFWGGTGSTQGALAATCADVVGRFAAYHRALFALPFDQEHGYTDPVLRDTAPPRAGITGAALTAFQTCFDNRQTADFAARMETLNATTPVPLPGRIDFDQGIKQVPTLFVNGVWVENPTDIPTTSPADALAYLRKAAGLA